MCRSFLTNSGRWEMLDCIYVGVYTFLKRQISHSWLHHYSLLYCSSLWCIDQSSQIMSNESWLLTSLLTWNDFIPSSNPKIRTNVINRQTYFDSVCWQPITLIEQEGRVCLTLQTGNDRWFVSQIITFGCKDSSVENQKTWEVTCKHLTQKMIVIVSQE